MEKSPSRNAASRFDNVCSGKTTLFFSAAASPHQNSTTNTVSVHWSFSEKSPVHSSASDRAPPGRPMASASSRMRAS